MYKDFYKEQQEQEIKEQQQKEIEKQQEQEREDEEKLEEYFKELDEQKIQERIDEDGRIARLKQEIEEERELKEQLEKEAIELEELDLKRLAGEQIDDQRDGLKQEEDERLQADAREQEERSEQERNKTEMKLEQERNSRQSVKDYQNGGKGFKEYVNNSSALRFQKRPRMQRLQEERGRQLEWHVRYQNAVQRNELDQWKSRDPESRNEYYQQRIDELEQGTSAQLESEIQPVDLDQILAEYDQERGAPTQDDILLNEAAKENATDILRTPDSKDNVLQFPLDESANGQSIDAHDERLSEVSERIDENLREIEPHLNKAEHALYERQLGYLMADKIAEHEREGFNQFMESLKDDPNKFELASERLAALEAFSEKEMDDMKNGLLQPDTDRDLLSELDREEMELSDKIDDLYINSLEADDCKFMAKVNLTDAEIHRNSVYGALDQWVEHHREHHIEIHPLVQQARDELVQEVRENWPEYDRLSLEIEHTEARDRDRYEQDERGDFANRVDDTVSKDISGSFDENSHDSDGDDLGDNDDFDHEHALRPFTGHQLEVPAQRSNSDSMVERDENFNQLVDRYAEEHWSHDGEYETDDYDCNDSDKVNELMRMEDSQAKDLDKMQSPAEPDQSRNQEMKPRDEDEWDR